METNTLISLTGVFLTGATATIGVYVSMNIRQALLKNEIAHHNDKIKTLERKVHDIERDMIGEIKSIHNILSEIKISIVTNNNPKSDV